MYPRGNDGKKLHVKVIIEIHHNIESTNDKMVGANPNLKCDNMQWYRKDAYSISSVDKKASTVQTILNSLQ